MIYLTIITILNLIPVYPKNHTVTWRQGWMRGRTFRKKHKIAKTWIGSPAAPSSSNQSELDTSKPSDKNKTAVLNATPYFSDKDILTRIRKTGWGDKIKNLYKVNKQPDGQRCLSMLTSLGIPYKPGPPKPRLKNPVIVLSKKIGGVYYHWYWGEKHDLLLDCRMVLSLYLAAPVFLRYGFDEVLYTSSYRYTKVAGTRRWSRHASGMALDVKALRGKKGLVAVVERDWIRVFGDKNNCVGSVRDPVARKMRALICDFEKFPLFRRILTPDSNHAHRDHFHFSGAFTGEKWHRRRYAGRVARRPLASYFHKPVLKYPLPPRPKCLDSLSSKNLKH